MRILLIGERYSSNLGDGIICEVVESLLQTYYSHSHITVADISGRSDYEHNFGIKNKRNVKETTKKIIKKILFKLNIDINNILKLKRKKYIKKICRQDYDIAIFAGGHLLKDTFIPAIEDFTYYLALNKTPIIFNACGAAKIKDYELERTLKRILNKDNVVSISIRDDVERVNSLYLKESNMKALPTHDPGIWAKDIYKINKKDSETIGLGIMLVPHIEKNKIIKFWKEIITALEKESISWRMFCNGSEDDYELAKYILRDMSYSEYEIEDLLDIRPKRPKELVKIISEFNSIISFRLHSHIIAYSLDIPSIAIVWDDKVEFFFEKIGYTDRCKKIEDNSTEIVNTLINAQQKPYESNLRVKQKKQSLDILVKSIEGNI